ncbi:protein EFR3 homolog A-like [Bactrocera tryoni]|uniref:protein EFR3 homolog A-like n=1 Tax=Bactrocera tryoni TaxID=59916 RepID=UPI001A95F2FC|nr:protein EFR3 homolog A-like [Bactrocera tryoni]
MPNILKSRHKRLVNKIYPKNPYEGLRRDNLKRLLLYAHNRQENYIRVLTYLTTKLKKYVVIDQEAYIKITMEALNSVIFGIVNVPHI